MTELRHVRFGDSLFPYSALPPYFSSTIMLPQTGCWDTLAYLRYPVFFVFGVDIDTCEVLIDTVVRIHNPVVRRERHEIDVVQWYPCAPSRQGGQ